MPNDADQPAPGYVEGQQQSGVAPAPVLLPAEGSGSLAVAIARAEIDGQVATAHAFPRKPWDAQRYMTEIATRSLPVAEDCIYSLPRGGKQVRGPSIRFAEIIASTWGNCRDAARVIHVDRLERFVECEAVFHDLESNRGTTTIVRRTIELKRGRTTVDLDMIQLAGAAGMSIARRNAILGGVPRFIWEPVQEAIEKTIRGEQRTLVERRDRAIGYFAKIGVTIEKLLKALGKEDVDGVDLDDLMTMNGWRVAIQQGDSTQDELFPEDRKLPAKTDLGGQLDALAKQDASPPVGDAAGASGNNPLVPEALPEGAAANAPEGAAGVAATTPAAASVAAAERASRSITGLAPDGRSTVRVDPEANGKAAGAPRAQAGAKAGANGPKGAGAPDRGAEARAARQAALAAAGDAKASQGPDVLSEWLDNLSGGDAALITPAMEARWKEMSE